MSRNTGKKARKVTITSTGQENYGTKFPALRPQTPAQQDYLELIKNRDIVFALGSAGSGKSYVATHYAAEQLYYKKVDKIILTRPAVEACGEELGFLPGELVEGKLMPYLTPYMETLNDLLGKTFIEYCLKTGAIEPVPLAYMRGRSFGGEHRRCLILADEMQSATPMQMKLLLTRIGDNTKMLINGDIEQRDRLDATGLEDAIHKLKYISEVGVVQFTDDDCVRSGICRKVLKAYTSKNYN
jgi:phosphate starvation-inducible protein PhoH and related proteins